MTRYDETDDAGIAALLTGRKVTKVAEDAVLLDDGTRLQFVGNDGGCACSSGCYDLTELNGVDNVITRVELVNEPDDDMSPDDGTYRIFVYADNERINLATFVGTDGNGYYGTGYQIHVLAPDPAVARTLDVAERTVEKAREARADA